jgi:DNA-binding beta-propeller fold protein YncE
MASELPGRPFAIQKKWIIGGTGNWDYLTLDVAARQLFIAHGTTVQVVDLEGGAVTATVKGFRDANQIVLDDTGGFGYVSDGAGNAVKIFDRGSYQIVATILVANPPRSLVLDPSSGLLLAICAGPTVNEEFGDLPRKPGFARQNPHNIPRPASVSTLSVIDPQTRTLLANVWLPGKLGFAQADGSGRVYVSVEDENTIERLDVQAIAIELSKLRDAAAADKKTAPRKGPLKADWTGSLGIRPPADVQPFSIRLGGGCKEPRGLAVDARNNRLFVACGNQQMAVADSEAGRIITTLTIGPGADAIAYDASRGLIFTANGGGYGSLSIIRQHVTDTYAVIQNLPTLAQAHTMAVDPSTGEVYLVTTLYGAKLGNPPANGIGTLKMGAVDGSFQVLVIGR